MTVLKSILLFVVAALAEIGGAWLIWQGVREHRGWIWSSLAASRYSTGSGTTSRSSAIAVVSAILNRPSSRELVVLATFPRCVVAPFVHAHL